MWQRSEVIANLTNDEKHSIDPSTRRLRRVANCFRWSGHGLVGFLGDPQAGSMIGDCSLLLLAKLESKRTCSRTTSHVSHLVFSWTRLLRALLQSFLDGHENELKSGDAKSAMTVSTWEFNKARRGDPNDSMTLTNFRSFAVHCRLP
jgi:hypothetical protein